MSANSAANAPANDAHLVQNVRGELGRSGLLRNVNVSSCGFVVALHGVVEDESVVAEIEARVRRVAGVSEVENKLRRNEDDPAS